MPRIVACIFFVICLLALVSGCYFKASNSFTFNLDNGDVITLSLETTDDYDLVPELPFVITHDGVSLSQGTFIQGDAYEQYVSAMETDEKVELLDSGQKDGNEYVFWSYDGSEYNYAILIGDSNTGILLGNAVSEESAKECFNRLTVSAED